MATIQHKRSDTSGVTPLATELVNGEIALNTADGTLFTKHSDGTIVPVADVASDASPVLGGDLDVAGNNINLSNAGVYSTAFTGDGTDAITWDTALPSLSSTYASVTGGSSIHQTYLASFFGAYDILEVTCRNSNNSGTVYLVADDSINFGTQTTSSTTPSNKMYVTKTGVTIPSGSSFTINSASSGDTATCARNLMFTRNAGSISFGDTTTGVVVDQDNSFNTDFYDKRSTGNSNIRFLGAMANGSNHYALDIEFDSANNTSNVELKANGVTRLATTSTGVTVTGSLTATGDVTAYSDARLKENIKTIDNALDKVCNLRGVSYNKDGKKGIGVIAQEVEEIIPEVVGTHDDKDATRTVAYGNMVGVLIEAIKEQQQQIEDLKDKVTELGGYD